MFADIGVGFWVRAGKTMPTTRTFVPTLHLKVCLLECRASLGCMYGIEAIVRSRRRHSQEPTELEGGLQVCTFVHSHYLTEIKPCQLFFLKRISIIIACTPQFLDPSPALSLVTLRRALLLQLEGGAVKALGRYPLVKFAPCHPAHSPFSLATSSLVF